MGISSLAATDNLVGMTINGWNVVEKLAKSGTPSDTGGNFSICYRVEKDGKYYFMKVLNYKDSILGRTLPGVDRSAKVAQQFSEFSYEKDLSIYCNTKKISKVILYIDSGEVDVEGFLIPTVSYIVYEMAEGNIRHFLKFSTSVDFLSKFKSFADKLESLRDVATGISNLHGISVSHQDIKPSNIMKFQNESKIGDLGRSLCFDSSVHCPYPFKTFHGDWTYAPPEAIFQYHIPDVKERLYQMDNYTLGGLIVFYLTGISINALLDKNLPSPIRVLCSSGISFEAAKTFLLDTFQKSLKEIREEIPLDSIREDLIHMIEYLCFPIPERRGHPININPSNRTPNYDLQRTITELDVMYKRAKFEISKL